MKTFVTCLTSHAPAAIGVIEIDGPECLSILEQCWTPNQGNAVLRVGVTRYGIFHAPSRNAPSVEGESVVVCRIADDRVEVHCHGGRYASEAIVRQIVSLGAIERTKTQWISNSVSDPIEQEAIEDLTRAITLRTAKILLDQQRGALRSAITNILSTLHEANIVAARDAIQRLLDYGVVGCHSIEPWRVVLAGPPNAGKSSLLNHLLGYTRAIVHESAGTTRDLLVESTSFDGWPMELIDSAGVRSSDDAIESDGIARTLKTIESADLVLILVDSTEPWNDTHQQIASACLSRCIVVFTKMDRHFPIGQSDSPQTDFTAGTEAFEAAQQSVSMLGIPSCATSVKSGEGVPELVNRIVERLVPIPFEPGLAVPFRTRQVALLRRALELIDAKKCNEAIECLGRI